MRTMAFALALMAVACDSEGSSPSTDESTPVGSEASTTPPLTREEFVALRDQICADGSGDIAAINEAMEGVSGQDLADGFASIAERIRQAQGELDELEAPAELQEFVKADNDRRARRIAYVEQLGAAAVNDPSAMADIDAELTALNIETESEEDAHGTLHCP